MQLGIFYDVLLQLFDSLMVANAVFFDVFMVKEASFLPFSVMIFQGGSMCFTPTRTNF